MRVNFSFLSKNQALLGIDVQVNAQVKVDKKKGTAEMGKRMDVTFGLLFFYVEFSFAVGKTQPASEFLDMDFLKKLDQHF